MQMDASLFALIQNSNQVVHNRGRALAYLRNAGKKRRVVEGGGNGNEGDGGAQQHAEDDDSGTEDMSMPQQY